MQLSGIIAFLLLLQYEVSSRHNGHFTDELELNSLVEHFYDDASLDPDEDNDEIEDIANAILEEADRRLKKRELNKNRHDDTNEDDEKKLYQDDKKERHKKYRSAISDDHNKIVNSYKEKIKRNENKREIYEDEDKENNKDKIDDDVKKSEVKVSDSGDNVQVASVKVDNEPDEQTRLAHNAAIGRHLFLEPNANISNIDNTSTYAHKGEKLPPLQKITTSKIDRSGLDEFSFIAVVVGCCVAGISGIGLASFCWYKLRSETKGLTNGGTEFKSNSLRGSDRKKPTDEEKLTRGAEVFHYLHAKKQMQQMEEPNLKSDHHSINESSDDEDDEDTVYECPGLAPPGDMKVVNPLFSDAESHYSDAPSIHSTPTPPSEEK